MKRDMDLIRDILIEIEAHNDWPAGAMITPEDASKRYHLHLLLEAGLVEGKEHHFVGGPIRFSVDGLTWAGHEFLAATSDQNRWNKFKQLVGGGLASLPFPVITKLLADGIEHSARASLQSQGFIG